MSRQSVKRNVWRKIGQDMARPKGGLLPDWVGGLFVGLVLIAIVISFFI